MAFHDVVFPEAISFGATGGPRRLTRIVELASGQELRQTPWSRSRHIYNAGTGVRSLDDIYEILCFFEAREGQLHGFRWRDWLDYQSCAKGSTPNFSDQKIGRGDNLQTEFQLVKCYQRSEQSNVRKITRPVANSVTVGIDNRECEASEFEIDIATGIVSFHLPPESGAPIFAGYKFDVPVRFDCEYLEINLANFEAGEIPEIPIVEIFE